MLYSISVKIIELNQVKDELKHKLTSLIPVYDQINRILKNSVFVNKHEYLANDNYDFSLTQTYDFMKLPAKTKKLHAFAKGVPWNKKIKDAEYTLYKITYKNRKPEIRKATNKDLTKAADNDQNILRNENRQRLTELKGCNKASKTLYKFLSNHCQPMRSIQKIINVYKKGWHMFNLRDILAEEIRSNSRDKAKAIRVLRKYTGKSKLANLYLVNFKANQRNKVNDKQAKQLIYRFKKQLTNRKLNPQYYKQAQLYAIYHMVKRTPRLKKQIHISYKQLRNYHRHVITTDDLSFNAWSHISDDYKLASKKEHIAK